MNLLSLLGLRGENKEVEGEKREADKWLDEYTSLRYQADRQQDNYDLSHARLGYGFPFR